MIILRKCKRQLSLSKLCNNNVPSKDIHQSDESQSDLYYLTCEMQERIHTHVPCSISEDFLVRTFSGGIHVAV